MAKRNTLELFEIKCSRCGAPLKLKEGELIICPYCGTQFAFEDFEEEEEDEDKNEDVYYYEPSFWDTESGRTLLRILLAFGTWFFMGIVFHFI